MSGVDYEAAPCPCGCGRPLPKGRRWATASCGNKARAAKRRAKCPELRPETPAEVIYRGMTERQRAEFLQCLMREASKAGMGPTITLPIPLGRRPDPRTGKKRPRVYLDAQTVEDLERLREGRYQGASWQEIVYEAVAVLYNREFLQ